ncbi:hypothetical protein KC331_g15007 [Hortaea werneckii]|uniref:Uncharacterized protein n=1 Tax=Hortaea werneckii TaxID=91943 RepID=A0A3M7D7J6_HORWE|nr:hypothetical protein KC331_g15007 [Hortaea werneckii]KAI7704983.1 hypothetical protein KC353_g13154 [Hortaea werneckii]RMY60200.1 hypothetical protein D0865_01659 [Hortaea werneckii]
MEPSPTISAAEEAKGATARRLMNCFASRSIDQRSYDLLHRMAMLISGMGADIHVVIQSEISHISTLQRIEWYINSELEACDFLREHLESRCQTALRATGRLPRLPMCEGMALKGALDAWRPVLRTLHKSTGHETGIFEDMINLFDIAVWRDFSQLRGRQPHSKALGLQDLLVTLQTQLSRIQYICSEADEMVDKFDQEYQKAVQRLQNWSRYRSRPPAAAGLQLKTTGTIAAPTTPESALFCPQHGSSGTTGNRTIATLKTPSEPPQLPLLPFQVANDSSVALLQEAPTKRSLLSDALSATDREGLYSRIFADAQAKAEAPKTARLEPSGSHSNLNKSFSVVEDKVMHRGHFRHMTDASDVYTAGSSRAVGPDIAQPAPRLPHASKSLATRRKGRKSQVPRVFTGSFHDLEDKAYEHQLHKIKTPEYTQPSSPSEADIASVTTSGTLSPEAGPVARDFADLAPTPSNLPSPGSQLQRREAVVSRDAQWEDRIINGEVVLSRRPDRLQRAQTIDDRSSGIEGLEKWLRQQSEAHSKLPGTQNATGRHASGRQRENTL